MFTPKTTTETGTVTSVTEIPIFKMDTVEHVLTYTIQIIPDNSRVTLAVETLTSPEVGVGDKVSYTVARSNAGIFVTEVTKIA